MNRAFSRVHIRQARTAGGRTSHTFTGATCLGNDLMTTTLSTTQVWPPPSGAFGYYYLDRGQNSCGNGSYGNSTIVPDPRDALDGAAPCP